MTEQTFLDRPAEKPIVNFPDFSDRMLFVGSSRFFSDPFLRVLGNELDGVELCRVSPPELDGVLTGNGHERPVLAIVGEEAAREMGAARLMAFAKRLDAPVALACRECDFAQELAASGLFPSTVRGVIPLHGEIELIFSALRVLMMGGSFLPPDIRLPQTLSPILPDAQARPDGAGPFAASGRIGRLTRREREVLGLVARGYQNKKIAATLALSEHTVKLHVHHIISKLGVSNRTEAALSYPRGGA